MLQCKCDDRDLHDVMPPFFRWRNNRRRRLLPRHHRTLHKALPINKLQVWPRSNSVGVCKTDCYVREIFQCL